MKRVKITLLLFVLSLFLFAFFSIHKFRSNGIQTVANRLILKSLDQEKTQDATCWATNRQMQSHHLNIKIHPLAVPYQIEATKQTLYYFWSSFSTNPFNVLTDNNLSKKIPVDLSLKMKMLSATKVDSKNKLSLNQQLEVTENLRYLLSILYSYDFAPYTFKLAMPTKKATNQLANFANVLTLQLLQYAKENALQDKSHYILADHILLAQKQLLARYKVVPLKKSKVSLFNFKPMNLRAIKQKSQQLVEAKIEALSVYNQKDVSLQTALKKVNLLVDVPFDESGLQKFFNHLVALPKTILYGQKPLSFILKKNISNEQSIPIKNRLLDLLDVSESLDILFPITYKDNADVVLLKRDSLMQESSVETVRLYNYDMDGLRDTGLHWEIIKFILKDAQSLAIDPFANELLAEAVSVYATYYLQYLQAQAKLNNQHIISSTNFHTLGSHSTYWLSSQEDISKFTSKISKQNKQIVLKDYNYDLFTDVSNRSGISNINYLQTKKYRSFFNYTGNGVGAGDVNNDNYIDLFFPGEGGSKLYINNQDFTFTDKTDQYFTEPLKFNDSRQGIFVDINNDNLLDLFVVHSNSNSQLWIQNEQNKFINITKEAGIKTNPLAHNAVFFDFNNDGLLDIFVAHYGPKQLVLNSQESLKEYFKKSLNSAGVFYKSEEEFEIAFKQSYPQLKQLFDGKKINKQINLDATNAENNQFYLNLGNNRFKQCAKEVGLESTRYSLAAAAVDYNDDGYMDLHVVNDFGFDQVYLNQGGTHFIQRAQSLGLDDRGNGMNISIIDINNDTKFDSYITVIDMFAKKLRFKFPSKKSLFELDNTILNTSFYLTGNKLFLNNQTHFNTNFNTINFEPAELGWGWGATFFDYENDTDLDMYIANGFKKDSIADSEQNHMFISDNANFYLIEEDPVLVEKNSRAVLSLDLDNNGFLDLVISNHEEPPQIFRNNAKIKNNWLKVRLRSTKNTHAIGAKVTIVIGDNSFTKLVSAGSQYMSQEDTTLTFGLAKNTQIDSFHITWPKGKFIKYEGPFQANSLFEITEDEKVTRINF